MIILRHKLRALREGCAGCVHRVEDAGLPPDQASADAAVFMLGAVLAGEDPQALYEGLCFLHRRRVDDVVRGYGR